MKKYLLSTVALSAIALMATSCSDEQAQDLKAGVESTVTFTAQLPSEMATRAFADGTKATELHYAVYEKGTKTRLAVCKSADGAQTNQLEGTATMTGLQTTISLQLTTGKEYDFVFWAAKPGNAVYTFSSADQSVSVNPAALTNNTDDLDAFFTHDSFKVDGNKQINEELRRPFAQINIGTDDFEAAKASGYEVSKTSVSVDSYKTLNLFTEAVSDAYTAEFAEAALPTENTTFTIAGKDYKYLSMSYALVPADKETVDVKFDYTDGTTPLSRTFANVPVQRNYRTNIYGSLLTNSVDFNVEIKPAFETPDYNVAYASSALRTNLAAGGTVVVGQDMTLAAFNIPAGVTSELNLNGKTVKTTGSATGGFLVINGNLTIDGDGYIGDATHNSVGYMFNVNENSTLTIKGNATYECGLTCIQMQGANSKVEIYGGKWIGDAYNGKYWTLNKIDAYKDNSTIVIYGGSFYKFDPSNSTTENPAQNWVAPGYKVVQNGDWYDVVPE